MRRIVVFLIRLYQKTLSPFIGNGCRYIPTCSEYTIEAVKKYGVFKGCYLGVKRIIRCNPASKGGFDFVP